jgi:type 1 glutamine amidotransferase
MDTPLKILSFIFFIGNIESIICILNILLKFIRLKLSLKFFVFVVGFVLMSCWSCGNTSDKQHTTKGSKEVIFIAGTPSHGYGAHEHRAGCELLARLLEENAENIVTKVYSGGWPEEEAFEQADAIVIFSDGGADHMVIPHLASLNEYMKRGVGLGVLHYALVVPAGKAGDYFLDWIGGFFETDWSVNPFWTAQFKNIPQHEVTKGVKSFEIVDEWYYHMRFNDQGNIIPVLSALPPASSLDRKDGPYSNNPYVREAVLERREPQHLMWLFERTGMPGRGFGHTGCHYHWEWGHPDFRTLVLNAILWIAGVEVPETGISTPVLTIEDLEINQDYKQPDDFDRKGMIRQLELWQAGHDNKP